jgi:hypothetical protein
MRTTVSIQDALLRQAKEASVQRGCSLSEVVEDALRVALASRPKTRRTAPGRRWKTYRGSGLRPGVDLKASAALLEVMED